MGLRPGAAGAAASKTLLALASPAQPETGRQAVGGAVSMKLWRAASLSARRRRLG